MQNINETMTIEQAFAWMRENADWITSQQLTSRSADAMWLQSLTALYRIAPDRYESLLIETVINLKGQFDAAHASTRE